MNTRGVRFVVAPKGFGKVFSSHLDNLILKKFLWQAQPWCACLGEGRQGGKGGIALILFSVDQETSHFHPCITIEHVYSISM